MMTTAISIISEMIPRAGGAAGMVSKITGSVGKGLAAITMDKEYQQKRREEMNRPPKDFGESLAKGGKGLLKVQSDRVQRFVCPDVSPMQFNNSSCFCRESWVE